MSGLSAISATGQSLQRVLVTAFAQRSPLVDEALADPQPPVVVELANTQRLEAVAKEEPPVARVLLFLYRVDVDKAMRAAWSAVGSGEGRGRLALNLHYLLIPFAADAVAEQRLLGRSLQALESAPVLSGPLLLAPAGLPADEPTWEAQEAIHLGLEELSTEALMRLFDTLPLDYRLCVPYCARVVRIDAPRPVPTMPVFDAQLRVHPLRVEP
jgi:Pvc16 N-terminal domain